MALGKSIANARTGHANTYWRLTALAIDAHSGHVAIVLSGYADAVSRQSGRHPDDRRDWNIGPAAFAGVAARRAVGATVYDVIAKACYDIIVNTRRPIPPGTQRQEDGSVVLPDGEVVPADQVVEDQGVPTIPSEFADAAAV